MSFQAGNSYKAKVIDAGLRDTKDGQPQAFMKFDVSDGDDTGQFYWTGSFKSEKSTELTIKALLTAGFAGNDADELSLGLVKFMPKDFTVELEDNNGKMRVKWVNSPKVHEAFKGKAPSLAGQFAKFKAELGIKSDVNW